MRNGHIIYKVSDLDRAVMQWREKGFDVEYGRKKRSINALIYFSEGAYIELLGKGALPKIINFFSTLFGRKRYIQRFIDWENANEGWCGLCIEKDSGSLDKEVEYLKSFGIDGLLLNNLKRNDTKDRELKYKCFFPVDKTFPFLMSYFEIDPKPKNFVHPNSIKKIKKVVDKSI